MKIYLGEEYDVNLNKTIHWIQSNIDKEKYRIIEEGFLLNEYYVEFVDEKYATLFYLRSV